MAKPRRTLPSISTPIIMASIAVPLAVALLVGWTLVFAREIARHGAAAGSIWLLVLGVVAFVTIMAVMVMFAIFLGREILEVRRQDSFIDSVTHELKSPLASIKLGLQTMGRRGIDEDKREVLREMMLGDVDRLSDFVDDILQASRLAHGRLDRMGSDLATVDLGHLVHECVAMVQARHNLAPEAIEVVVEEGLEAVTDRSALALIVRNLIDNAVKYSGDRVAVRAEARSLPRGFELRVRDEGIGIPVAEQKRIFQRFYRVSAESVRSQKGTGLGLFVVSALVRNLDGTIEALSEGAERGTTMIVRLPTRPLTHDDDAD